MGLAGMVINVAPAIGPPIGGVLIKYFEWRSLFHLTLPITALIIILMYLYRRDITEQKATGVDLLSVLPAWIGFCRLLYGFNMLQESGWNDAGSVIGLIAGAVALILFVLRQFRLQIPILELRVLKVPLFTLVTVVSILSFSL